MDTNNVRNWVVLSWNVRGVNATWKWDAVKNKILQSACDIVCLQETKKEMFDLHFLKNVCPSCFNCFEYLPSVGASGGILVAWKVSLFSRAKIYSNCYSLTVEFTSNHNDAKWILTCVYGPCTHEGKVAFINWFREIQMPNNVD
jgi:exonuclease III